MAPKWQKSSDASRISPTNGQIGAKDRTFRDVVMDNQSATKVNISIGLRSILDVEITIDA